MSPEHYIAKINTALKGDNNWAGKERTILKLCQNASVKDSIYTEIVALTPEMTQEELKKQYDKELASLLLAADERNKITKTVPVDVKLTHTEEEILELLAIKLEKPELSEHEKYLLSLIEDGKTAQLDDMKREFSNETTDKCPFCLQNVSTEYKVSLIESIEKVLLRPVLFPPIPIVIYGRIYYNHYSFIQMTIKIDMYAPKAAEWRKE